MLNVVEEGELFGEVALLDGSPRTASVTAMEDTDLLRIHRVPLSQHDLGGMVGAARETINKQCALWRSAGSVDIARGTIVIRNCEALRARVGCA